MPSATKFQAYIDGRNSMAVTPRPRDCLTPLYGKYRLVAETGTIGAGAAADSEIFEFRFDPSDTNMRAIVRRIFISAISLGTGFSAGQCIIEAKFARAFTVAGTGGGAVTLTTNQAKMRTAYGTSLAEARVSTTAALTAGTQTLDTLAFASAFTGVGTAAYTQFIGVAGQPLDLFHATEGNEPIVIAGDEGFVIRATVPATGTWAAAIGVEWDEDQLNKV